MRKKGLHAPLSDQRWNTGLPKAEVGGRRKCGHAAGQVMMAEKPTVHPHGKREQYRDVYGNCVKKIKKRKTGNGLCPSTGHWVDVNYNLSI